MWGHLGVLTFEVGDDTTYQLSDDLEDNTIYFWQVLAYDILGFETFNENGYSMFYTNLQNDPPSLSSLVAPLDGSIQTDLSPNMYWTESHDIMRLCPIHVWR